MFRAVYGVITQPWGPWSVTLGVGKGHETPLPGTRQPLDGVFGGVDYRLPASCCPAA